MFWRSPGNEDVNRTGFSSQCRSPLAHVAVTGSGFCRLGAFTHPTGTEILDGDHGILLR